MRLANEGQVYQCVRSEHADSGERREDWRFDYLFSIGVASWIIHLCVIALASVVLIQADLGSWVSVWIIVMAALSLSLSVLTVVYRRHKANPFPGYIWGVAHSGLTAIVGIIWGIGAILCARSNLPLMLTFYTLVLGGTALGAVSSQHILMRSCLLSIWTSIPLLAFAWLVNGIFLEPLVTAVMVILYGIMLTTLAIRMNHFLTQSVMLADELAARNKILIRTSSELAETQEEKSRFLAQASHDLRQPIHAIGLFVEYLHGTRMGRDGHDVLNNIDRSLASLTQLCRSLLDLSALDIGRIKPEIESIALDELIGEVVRQASESARVRNVVIKFRPSQRWVRSDPSLLHTMVQNLVSNAIKYAPGARLLLGVRRRRGTLSIVVVDGGPGIAEEDQKRIFKEFVQIKTPGMAEADGLGLGLSIVRRLADMLGLHVGLTSQLGKGSTFSVDGLIEVVPEPTPRLRRNREHVPLLEGLRVLIVDDDRSVCDSTAQLLTRWGCIVHVTDHLIQAPHPEGFNFILTDYQLVGDEDGLSIIRRIRESSQTPVAAAIITGARIDHLIETCRMEQIVILAKPVRPAQLRSVLLSGITAHRSQDQTIPRSEAIPAAAVRLPTPSNRSNADT